MLNENLTSIAEGIEVLNMSGGGVVEATTEWAVTIVVVAVVICALMVLFSIVTEDAVFILVGIAAGLVILVFVLFDIGVYETTEPIRYEVTIQPGHVLDAARWEVVEQRGQIYVITEREVAG